MMSNRRQERTEWFSGGARFLDLPRHDDERGSLLPIEFDRLPFTPRRVFTVTGVPAGTVRGAHAHRKGEQLLVCLQGCIEVYLSKGDEEHSVELRPDSPGLLLGPLVWCRQTYVRPDTVLLVVASESYDPDSYILSRGS